MLAQLGVGFILSELPACSKSCTEKVLLAAGCALGNIQNCICKNTTVQSQLYECTYFSCDIMDLSASTFIVQNLICNGIPQPSRSANLIRVFIIFTILAFVAIILRLISRLVISKFWWDDWTITAASVFLIPLSVIQIYNATKGFGNHIWDIPPANVANVKKFYFISEICYEFTKSMAKTSILFLFLRIFPDNRFRLCCKIFLAWLLCSCFAFSMAVTFQCTPVNAVWDSSVGRRCINSRALILAAAGISIFEDMVMIMLPVSQVAGLNLSSVKRLAAMCMFAIASFACITSMVRLRFLATFNDRSIDPSWDSADVDIWSFLEVCTAVICACLVAIRPLLAKCMPSIFQSTCTTRHYSHTFHTLGYTGNP